MIDAATGILGGGIARGVTPLGLTAPGLAANMVSGATSILTNEHSGHYGQNWMPETRNQFQNVMEGYGLPVMHSAW